MHRGFIGITRRDKKNHDVSSSDAPIGALYREQIYEIPHIKLSS